MRNLTRGLIPILAAIAALGIATGSTPWMQQENVKRSPLEERERKEFEKQFPIVDKNKPEPADPEGRATRWAISKKYNKAIQRLDERVDTIVLGFHSAGALPALPAAQSKVIVVGEVTKAQAYLSEDESGVYSEFTIRIDSVLKNSSEYSLEVGSSLVAERSGGRVRFPSGHVVLTFMNGEGMPQSGRRYVLFLTPNTGDNNFTILTGYELKDGQVELLDNLSSTHPSVKLKGMEVDVFLTNLQSAITGMPGNQIKKR